MRAEATFYDRLGVRPDADRSTLRAAYHRRARELHPDLAAADGPDHHLAMAQLNEAWAVLSDPDRRSRYDALVRRLRSAPSAGSPGPGSAGRTAGPCPAPPAPAPAPSAPRVFLRREAWFESLRVRIRFLATMAGRSAVQSMLVRHHGTARERWEALVPLIVDELGRDTENRIRFARQAGAAPLDLANAAALVGLRACADRLAAQATGAGADRDELVARAQMVDRMFEALAHELPRNVVQAVGDAPRIARRLGARR